MRAATLELFRIEEGEDSSYHGTSKAGATNRCDFALKGAKKGGVRENILVVATATVVVDNGADGVAEDILSSPATCTCS